MESSISSSEEKRMQYVEREYIFGNTKLNVVYEVEDSSVTNPSKSTGLTVWPAAEMLCKYIVSVSSTFANKRVLEVGSGLALCGLLCTALGTEITVITDKSREVLDLLQTNVQKNFANETDRNRIQCKYLKWGENLEEFQERNGQFDIILASDVVYNDMSVSPLAATVAALLSDKPSSTFILGHVSRDTELDNKFFKCMDSFNFIRTMIPLDSFMKEGECPCSEYVPPNSLRLIAFVKKRK